MEQEKQKLNMEITAGSLLKYAFPTMIANVFMSIYSTVDGIFVSNVIGTDALSAVNIVMPYVLIVLAMGTLFGTGGSSYVALQLGAGRNREAKENFSMIVCVCFLGCCVISSLSLIFLDPLLHLLGANDVVFDYCMEYATPLCLIAPLVLVGMALQPCFIAAGKPGLGMTFSVLGGVLNVFLDWFLIAKLDMGVQGAALATGLGYSVPAVAGIIYFTFFRTGTLCFVRPKWRGKVLLKTITNGSSEMVAMMSSGITTVMMNNIVMGIVGEDGVAAISILIYAMSLLTSMYMGYSLGVASISSYNYGAGNKDKLKKANRINIRFIMTLGIVMYVFGWLVRSPLISIFAKEGSEVYQMASEGYALFSISFIYMGINMYASSLFTALGDGKTSAFISFFRGLIFLMIALYGLSAIFGLNGLWIAMPVAEGMGLVLSIYFLKKKKKIYHF